MKILFIDCCSILLPAAHTNRLLSLARGCSEAGHEVSIYCLGRAEGAEDEQLDGFIGGMHYLHMGRLPLVNRENIGYLGKLFHFLCVFFAVRRRFHDEDVDAVVIMNLGAHLRIMGLVLMHKYIRLAKRAGAAVFHERNEYPHLRANHNFFERHLLKTYLTKILPRLDGVAVMTQAIMEYFEKNVPTCPLMIHIPMTVEVERFEERGSRPLKGSYIAYCGTVFSEKDGVPILIKAFADVASEIESITLVLIGGDVDQKGVDSMRFLVNELGLEERVLFVGRVSREEVVSWLCHAEILALARPANLQAAGGFPTKLGEYLSTGRPVVVTATGEIPNYLRNGENAWVVAPDSVAAFAEALRNALQNMEESVRIGKAGKDVAVSDFSYRKQGQRFADFMENRMNTVNAGEF